MHSLECTSATWNRNVNNKRPRETSARQDRIHRWKLSKPEEYFRNTWYMLRYVNKHKLYKTAYINEIIKWALKLMSPVSFVNPSMWVRLHLVSICKPHGNISRDLKQWMQVNHLGEGKTGKRSNSKPSICDWSLKRIGPAKNGPVDRQVVVHPVPASRPRHTVISIKIPIRKWNVGILRTLIDKLLPGFASQTRSFHVS